MHNYFLLFFKYSCLHFLPSTPLGSTHLHLSPLIRPPLGLSMGPLYMFLDSPSPVFSIIPLVLPSSYHSLYFSVQTKASVQSFCFIWKLSFGDPQAVAKEAQSPAKQLSSLLAVLVEDSVWLPAMRAHGPMWVSGGMGRETENFFVSLGLY